MTARGDESTVRHTLENDVGGQRDALTRHLRQSIRTGGPALHRDERPGGVGLVDADGAHAAVVDEEVVRRYERTEGVAAARHPVLLALVSRPVNDIDDVLPVEGKENTLRTAAQVLRTIL